MLGLLVLGHGCGDCASAGGHGPTVLLGRAAVVGSATAVATAAVGAGVAIAVVVVVVAASAAVVVVVAVATTAATTARATLLVLVVGGLDYVEEFETEAAGALDFACVGAAA